MLLRQHIIMIHVECSILAPWSQRIYYAPSLFTSPHQLISNSPWLCVGSVLEHELLAGRPSGSEFLATSDACSAVPPGPAQNFNRHPELAPGRSPAITLRPQLLHSVSLSLLRISSQAPSQDAVTEFKDCQSVSLGGAAWRSAGGPLVGHWGQQTLGLTAASPRRNLHHHFHRSHPLSPLVDTLPTFHCLVPSLYQQADLEKLACPRTELDRLSFELHLPCLPAVDCGHPPYSRPTGRACARVFQRSCVSTPHTPSRALLT